MVSLRLFGWRLARRLVGHSGGSSPNTRIQTMAATRVDARVASAPNPASMPDHSRRLTKGLSNIAGIQADASNPRQIVSTIIDFARSSSASLTEALSKIQPVSTCSTEP